MKKIYPPSHLSTYLLISSLFHILFPWRYVIDNPYSYLGFIPMIIGIVLIVWTTRIFKKYKTTVRSDEKSSVLLKTGPFSFSRHPAYLGMILVLFGFAFILGSVTAFVGPVFFIAAMVFVFVPEEEKAMEEKFGEDYNIYKREVRRWI